MSLNDLPEDKPEARSGTVEPFPVRTRAPSPADDGTLNAASWSRPALLVATLVILEFGWIVASGIVSRLMILGAQVPGATAPDWIGLLLLTSAMAGMSLVMLTLTGGYDNIAEQNGAPARLSRPAASVALCFAFLALLVSALNLHALVLDTWIFAWGLAGVLGIVILRKIAQLIVRVSKADGHLKRRVVVFKAGAHGDGVLAQVQDNPDNVEIVAVFTDDAAAVRRTDGQQSKAVQELIDYARTHECDEVIVAVAASEPVYLRRILAALSVLPCEISVCPALISLPVAHVSVDAAGSALIWRVQPRPIDALHLLVKSALDRCLAVVALLLLSPLLLLIAAAIKYGSPGPVFFVQKRHGYNNRIIRVIKFRTMTVMEDGPVVMQARANDDRITAVGRILRKTSLDELPQLINVLKGEMSLVGPRPHALAHNEEYAALIERYANRHRIKPGITGWAQVNGFRGETKDVAQMRRRVEYDLYYIEHVSLLLDLKILLMTVWTVLSGRNAH